ncbi:MAG: GNAT family protein [Acidobacteriota bacterium]
MSHSAKDREPGGREPSAESTGEDQKLWFPPTLSTQRLRLRRLREDDAAAIFDYACDPQVARFVLWSPHATQQVSLDYVRHFAFGNYRREVPDPFGITLAQGDDRVIGTVGCTWTAAEHGCMELGYALARPHWGRGLMTEAAWAVVSFAFSIYRPQRIQARCMVDNHASARVLRKLSFHYEGRLRSAVRVADAYHDIELYSLLRAEWELRLQDGPGEGSSEGRSP